MGPGLLLTVHHRELLEQRQARLHYLGWYDTRLLDPRQRYRHCAPCTMKLSPPPCHMVKSGEYWDWEDRQLLWTHPQFFLAIWTEGTGAWTVTGI